MSTHKHHCNASAMLRKLGGSLFLGLLLALVGPAQTAVASCSGVTSVDNETRLDAALVTFNTTTTTPCVFTIELTADIPLTVSTAVIANATSGISLVIEGNGFAVDGQDTAGVRPFQIGADTIVTMNRLTVTGGNLTGGNINGGGILGSGDLTLSNVTVADNAITDQGAGMYFEGSNLTIENSTISGNSTAGGVGNSTGGGLYVATGTVTIRNSTFSGNSAEDSGGGIVGLSSTISIESSTIAYNSSPEGSGFYQIFNTGDTTFTNTILAANSGGADCDRTPLSNPPTDGGNNVVQTQNNCGFTDGVNGTIVGQDPLLDPLQDNGGATFTHALLAGSPAIGAGDTALTTDQRGIGRPSGVGADIGAFEVFSCTASPLDAANEIQLNAAIDCYNQQTTAGTYTINVTDDILLTASTTEIDNAQAGVELEINGGAFEVDGQGLLNVRPLGVRADTTVTINELTVRNGNVENSEGGGINSAGTLTLNDSKILENQSSGFVSRGGGIFSSGDLTLVRTIVSDNNSDVSDGGGIANRGRITVTDSTISGNSGGQGGGIYSNDSNNRESVISNSTISGNSGSGGAGIYNTSAGALTVRNSTFSGNTASGDGGGLRTTSRMSLDSVTFTGNAANKGGAFYVTANGSALVKNSIFANSVGGVDCTNEGSLGDGGHNLVETQSGCGFVDGVGGTIVGRDPNLGPLADNGGETETHALLDGSPAIDAGSTVLTTDQRGVARPQDGVADIGAFESACVGTAYDAATELELDQAIGCFNAKTAAGTYTINVTADINPAGNIAVIDNPNSGAALVIEGGGHVIDGGYEEGVSLGVQGFAINSDTAVTVNDLTVTRCRSLLSGPAIKNSGGGPLTLTDVSLTHNRSGFGGGALTIAGPATVTNSTIANNTTVARSGGGIEVVGGGSLELIDSQVSDNAAEESGGGIYIQPAAVDVTIRDSLIANNTAKLDGGGIFNESQLTIVQSTVAGNMAESSGGGVADSGTGTVEIRNSTLSGNTSSGTGGGLLAAGTVTLDSATVASNTASSIGGGVYLKGTGVLTLLNSILGDNTSTSVPGTADCGRFGGTTLSGSYNLLEVESCDFGELTDTVKADPKLGPLADNGGETETHALLPGSPAIDTGDTTLSTDQRGIARPDGAADDIGAFEAETGTLTITKGATPADGTDFDFALDTQAGAVVARFTLDDADPDDNDGIGDTISFPLPDGNYVVTETVPSGWDRSVDIDCQGSSGNIGTGNNDAFVDVAPGDDVVCTFGNRKLPTLTVVKDAAGADGAFDFEVSDSLGFSIDSFTLTTQNGTAQRSLPDLSLTDGPYEIAETALPADWVLADAQCSGVTDDNWSRDDNKLQFSPSPGDNAVCTFSNVKDPFDLTVVKQTVGGDATFAFETTVNSSIDFPDFSLTTAGGSAQTTLANLPAGFLELEEIVPTGWVLAGIECVGVTDDNWASDARRARVTASPGDNITCTYTNIEGPSSLIIVKETAGGDDSFDFTSDLPGAASFSLATSNGQAHRVFAGLTPGGYSVSETVPSGWALSDAFCDNGDDPGSITLADGKSVTCTFQNRKQDTLTIVKQTTGGDDSFDFTSVALGNFTLATVNGTASRSFADLSPGTYDVAESVPAGWDLTSASCDNGDDPASITLGVGESVTCTFANTRQETLTIVKQTTGGDGVFEFTSGALGGFTLLTANGTASRSFTNLGAGSYDVTEIVPDGWAQTGAACSNGDSPGNVTLAVGDAVTCTFENEKLDAITVVKQTVGGDAAFAFTSAALGDFTLVTKKGEAKTTFTDLSPGVYDIAEALPSGWEQVSAPVCSNGDDPGAITLAAGEHVICTFENRKLDTLVIAKQASGGDDSFDFTSNIPGQGSFSLTTVNGAASVAFDNLSAGTYSVSETLPSGWSLVDATCDNGDTPDSVTLNAGETVTCTFANTREDALVLVTEAVGADGRFAYTSTSLSPASFDQQTVNGRATRVFRNLAAGTYDLTQTTLSGWTLESATCDNGSDPAAIAVALGETVTCTFVNLRNDTLIIAKQATGADRRFSFSSAQAALGDFNLTTVNGFASRSFANLVPGTYDVVESVPTGWVLTDAACDNGDTPDSIDLAAGETVTCTFANAEVCDLNQDGSVSRADLVIIRGMLRSTVVPGSGGDINLDGRITSQDIRGCSLQCSLSGCAEPSAP